MSPAFTTEPATIAIPDTITLPRLTIQSLTAVPEHHQSAAGGDAIAGLQQHPKTLPPKYFYDDHGSDLFEQICDQPEYYVTRTEAAILQAHAQEIAQRTGPCELIELGSGSSTKTRLLLDTYLAKDSAQAFRYLPIDVSGGMLIQSAKSLLGDYTTLEIHGLVGTYTQALKNLPSPTLSKRLLFFLGSSLGNLNPQECQQFMDNVNAALRPGDYFLLGVDLQKPVEVLEAAYNDAQGVTAAFNLNMLTHLNRRFNGNFKVDHFQHHAFYNTHDHQIEMHLKSSCDQSIHLDALNFQFNLQANETIRTEISRKFNLETLANVLKGTQQGADAGILRPIQAWTDAQQWFGLILCERQ